VLAPIPSASDNSATAVMPGFFRKTRNATRTSRHSFAMAFIIPLAERLKQRHHKLEW
jgi:hypothetical protein